MVAPNLVVKGRDEYFSLFCNILYRIVFFIIIDYWKKITDFHE